MADVNVLKAKVYDLGEELNELQKQWNEKQEILKGLNEQIRSATEVKKEA